MNPFDLNQLRTFLHVVDTASFSGAAERMGITQPAVSLQIRILEKSLGVRVIDRVGKRAVPSVAGLVLVNHALRIKAEAEVAMTLMRRFADGKIGRVRIGTGATASIHLLPQVLQILKTKLPEVELSVITGNTSSMLDALTDNLIDLAFVTLPAKRRGLVVEQILLDPLVAVLPAGTRTVSNALGPRDFQTCPLILYERGGAMRKVIDDWFLAGQVAVHPVMELGDVEATKRFVAAGLGWSILPQIGVSPAPRELLVRPLRPTLRRTLGLVIRQDKVRDGTIRAALMAFNEITRASVTS